MAVTFDPTKIMTSDFYQENYSDDMGPSSKEIEDVLGIKLDSGLANFVDSITPKEAYEYLCKLLNMEQNLALERGNRQIFTPSL